MNTAKKVLFLSIIALGFTSAIIKVKDASVKTDIDVTSLFHPDHSIRYINSMEVMQKSEKGQKVAKELETQRLAWHEEINKMGERLQREVKEHTDKIVTYNEATREREEKRLAREKREYDALIQEREQDFKVAMGKATDQLLQEVEELVANLAKEEGWDAIIDTMTGRVLYAASEVEVSDSIVTAWDTKYKVDQKTVTT